MPRPVSRLRAALINALLILTRSISVVFQNAATSKFSSAINRQPSRLISRRDEGFEKKKKRTTTIRENFLKIWKMCGESASSSFPTQASRTNRL